MSLYVRYQPIALGGGGGGGGGVTSLNSETGAVVLVPGIGISVTPSGQNITIANTAPVTTLNGFNYLSSNTSVYGGTFSTLAFTGADNTVIGVGAGAGLTTGTNNTLIGFNAATADSIQSHNVVIGAGAVGGGNCICIGDSTATGGGDAVAVGISAIVAAEGVAVGYDCSALGVRAVGVGAFNNLNGNYSIGVGFQAEDNNAANSIIHGQGTPVNSTHSGCILLGTTNNGANVNVTTGAGQIVFGTSGTGGVQAQDMFLGRGAIGDATAPNCSVQPSPTVGTNIAGGNLTVSAGNGTGTGGSGSLFFQTAPTAASSSTANTFATVGSVSPAGLWTWGISGGTQTHVVNGALSLQSNQIHSLANGTASSDAVNLGQLQSAISGLTWKGPAQAYSASNVALTGGATLTIDGYSVQNGDLVILGNQTTSSQNGEYVASGIGTSYVLTSNGLPNAAGDAWLILNGTVYSDSAFVANAAIPSATFTAFAGPTAYTFTAPLSLTGRTVSITQSTTSTNGYLSSTDWNTFNGKQAAGNYITALTGQVTASGPGSATSTIAANTVTNSNLAQMATNTIKGNNTGGTANAADLTVAQVNTLLGTLSNPMTTLGDIIYENATPAPARLAGNTTTAINFLSQTGTGSASAAPTWSTFKPPTVQLFTTGGGTGTYTPTSSAILYVEVIASGGGGGGGGAGTTTNNGSSGGSTTLGSILTAGGGSGGASSSGGAGGTQSLTTSATVLAVRQTVGTPGNPGSAASSYLMGGAGGQNTLGGAGLGGAGNSTGNNGAAGTGAGGGGGGTGVTGGNSAGGGGSGGYISFIWTAPVATSYGVGSSGNGGGAGTGGNSGGAGAGGYLCFIEHYQ